MTTPRYVSDAEFNAGFDPKDRARGTATTCSGMQGAYLKGALIGVAALSAVGATVGVGALGEYFAASSEGSTGNVYNPATELRSDVSQTQEKQLVLEAHPS